MPDTWALIPAALLLATAGSAFVLLVPRPVLLVLLILVRSITDVGASNGLTLFPNTAINGAIAVTAILASLLPANARPAPRLASAAALTVAGLIFWTMIAISYFGFSFSYAGECLRVISVVSVLAMAYRIASDVNVDLPRCLNWVVGLPAVVLILGYLADFAPMLNPAGRATGTFGHANQAAAYFAVGAVACIWGFWRSSRRISLVVAIAALIALLLTQSLGGLAAIAGGAIVIFALNAKLPMGRRVLLIAGGLALVLILFLVVGASERLTELENVDYSDAESDNSLDWRFANWQALIPIWLERAPLLGLGFGSTRFDIRPFGQAPHSVPVQVLIETGAVGALIVVIAVAALARAIRRRSGTYPDTAAGLAGVCAVIAIHGLASNWLSYAAALYLAVFVVGIMLGASRTRESADGARGTPQRQQLRRRLDDRAR